MKRLFVTFLLSVSAVFAYCQDEAKLYKAQKFVWAGLDYSHVRCIGPYGFNDPKAIKNKYFDAWNDLMLQEAGKYNFKEAYQKNKQITDLSVAKRRNEMPVVGEFVIDEPFEFEPGTVKKIVSDYKLDQGDGIGLVYIVETLNKTREEAVINTVFFDLQTQEIIWQRKFTASAGGFGFRNYWARPIYEVIKESKRVYKKAMKSYYKSLKKK